MITLFNPFNCFRKKQLVFELKSVFTLNIFRKNKKFCLKIHYNPCRKRKSMGWEKARDWTFCKGIKRFVTSDKTTAPCLASQVRDEIATKKKLWKGTPLTRIVFPE